jgi:uncharacterized protein YdhG (YjbR/CyaY superfamily)
VPPDSKSGAKEDAAKVRHYLASLPPNARRIMNDMRAAVRAAAPKATEAISYGFPVFKLDGKPIVWCAAWKNHTSIYPMTAATKRQLAGELDEYDVVKGTIRFPLSEPPSSAFVKRLVKARLAELRANKIRAS